MSGLLKISLSWIPCGVTLIGIVGLLFGIFSSFWPRRSIALYEGVMAKINWRVSPIDEAREVRNTRALGILLILLSLALLATRFLSGI